MARPPAASLWPSLGGLGQIWEKRWVSIPLPLGTWKSPGMHHQPRDSWQFCSTRQQRSGSVVTWSSAGRRQDGVSIFRHATWAHGRWQGITQTRMTPGIDGGWLSMPALGNVSMFAHARQAIHVASAPGSQRLCHACMIGTAVRYAHRQPRVALVGGDLVSLKVQGTETYAQSFPGKINRRTGTCTELECPYCMMMGPRAAPGAPRPERPVPHGMWHAGRPCVGKGHSCPFHPVPPGDVLQASTF